VTAAPFKQLHPHKARLGAFFREEVAAVVFRAWARFEKTERLAQVLVHRPVFLLALLGAVTRIAAVTALARREREKMSATWLSKMANFKVRDISPGRS
jgi:hypothetical protein